MKPMLIAGNWKMNTTAEEATTLAQQIVSGIANVSLKSKVLVCPPFTNISTVSQIVNGSRVMLGSQNCHFEPKGAFTGEISLPMLKSLACTHVIIGHSERRAYFHESDELINKKAHAILGAGLQPIICIGETLEQRQSNKTFDVLDFQLTHCLKGIEPAFTQSVIIAYEPVWAIGTGIAAVPEQIDEAHNFIREKIVSILGNDAKQVPILYGGSLTNQNADSVFAIENVNGGLIGGASLKAELFLEIIQSSEKIA